MTAINFSDAQLGHAYGVATAIGRAIRSARVDRGETQQDLAAALGTTQPQIAHLEAGRCHNMLLANALRYLARYGLTFSIVSLTTGQPEAIDHAPELPRGKRADHDDCSFEKGFASVQGNVEITYLGTQYDADYVYKAGEIEITAIRYDDGSQHGRAADEHSRFYATIQKLAADAAWKDVYAMMENQRTNYGAF